jgi:hypothetical protein
VFLGSLYWAALSRNRPWLAALAGALCGMVKITTFFVFAAAWGAQWLYTLYRRKAGTRSDWRTLALAGILPAVASLGWSEYAHSVRGLNPLTEHFRVEALGFVLFGTLDERLSAGLWMGLFRNVSHNFIGERALWIASVPLILIARQFRREYWLTSALFLLFPLTFTHVHLAHTYYACAFGFLLVGAMAWMIAGLISDRGWRQLLGLGVLIYAVAGCVREYRDSVLPRQTLPDPMWELRAPLVKAVRELTPPDGVVLIYGFDWNPELPFDFGRRALMDREARDLDQEPMRSALQALAPDQIAAVVACSESSRNSALLTKAIARFDLNERPVLERYCSLYVRRTHP